MEDDLPYSIYMTLWTTRSPLKIVKLFTDHGWSWRNCAWDEYEIASDDVAELVIVSETPTLVSGGIAMNVDAILQIEKILGDGGIDFSFELYDCDDTLIRERKYRHC